MTLRSIITLDDLRPLDRAELLRRYHEGAITQIGQQHMAERTFLSAAGLLEFNDGMYVLTPEGHALARALRDTP